MGKKRKRDRKRNRSSNSDNSKSSENDTKDKHKKTEDNSETQSISSLNMEEETNQDLGVKEKIPPVVIQTKLSDPLGLMKAIKENYDPEVKFQFLSSGVKILSHNKETYDKLTAKLQQDKLEYHTYTTDNNRYKHLVLKGLYNTNTTDEVIECLTDKGFTPVRCIKMSQKKEKPDAPPFFMVSFDKNTKINEVRKIRYICSIVVRWEKYYNNRKVTQCHRCQQFGHGSSNCHRSPKCVKCAGDHFTSDCKKTPEQKPKCVNCSEEHPANYSKCSKYLEKLQYIEKLRASKQIKTKPTKVPVTTDFPDTLQQGESEKLQTCPAWGNKNNSKEPIEKIDQDMKNEVITFIEEFKILNEEIQKLKKLFNLSEMINIAKTLSEKFEQCKSDSERISAYLSFLTSNSKNPLLKDSPLLR